jgi:hypothetical protein
MKMAKRTKACVLVTAAVAATTMLAVPAASAGDGPTTLQLLDKCNNGTDVCDFHPSGSPNVYRGDYRLAGGATNCTADKITRWVEWSSTEHTTNSVGIQMSAEAGAGKAFKLGFEASYGHEWGWASTKTDRVQAEISPNRAINVFSAPMKQTVRGTYELHFSNPYYGHYIWYVNDVEVTGPASDSWDTRAEQADASC